jgi:hypothetical protein
MTNDAGSLTKIQLNYGQAEKISVSVLQIAKIKKPDNPTIHDATMEQQWQLPGLQRHYGRGNTTSKVRLYY